MPLQHDQTDKESAGNQNVDDVNSGTDAMGLRRMGSMREQSRALSPFAAKEHGQKRRGRHSKVAREHLFNFASGFSAFAKDDRAAGDEFVGALGGDLRETLESVRYIYWLEKGHVDNPSTESLPTVLHRAWSKNHSRVVATLDRLRQHNGDPEYKEAYDEATRHLKVWSQRVAMKKAEETESGVSDDSHFEAPSRLVKLSAKEQKQVANLNATIKAVLKLNDMVAQTTGALSGTAKSLPDTKGLHTLKLIDSLLSAPDLLEAFNKADTGLAKAASISELATTTLTLVSEFGKNTMSIAKHAAQAGKVGKDVLAQLDRFDGLWSKGFGTALGALQVVTGSLNLVDAIQKNDGNKAFDAGIDIASGALGVATSMAATQAGAATAGILAVGGGLLAAQLASYKVLNDLAGQLLDGLAEIEAASRRGLVNKVVNHGKAASRSGSMMVSLALEANAIAPNSEPQRELQQQLLARAYKHQRTAVGALAEMFKAFQRVRSHEGIASKNPRLNTKLAGLELDIATLVRPSAAWFVESKCEEMMDYARQLVTSEKARWWGAMTSHGDQ